MSLASRITQKFEQAVNKFGPMARQMYKRVVSSSGGNALLKRGVTVTKTDTLFNPQPFYERITEKIVLSATASAEAGDYKIGFSANSISIDDLKTKSLFLVLKDAASNEEVLEIFHYSDPSLQGEYFIFTVFARSKF